MFRLSSYRSLSVRPTACQPQRGMILWRRTRGANARQREETPGSGTRWVLAGSPALDGLRACHAATTAPPCSLADRLSPLSFILDAFGPPQVSAQIEKPNSITTPPPWDEGRLSANSLRQRVRAGSAVKKWVCGPDASAGLPLACARRKRAMPETHYFAMGSEQGSGTMRRAGGVCGLAGGRGSLQAGALAEARG
jgi:hypothetical protein